MNAQGLQIATPNDTTIVLTRTFNAPIRLVWDAMFTPEKMRRWMLPPPGWTHVSLVCEPRPGGILSVVWKSTDADPVMTLKGTFTEVTLHRKAVHTETMALANGQTIGTLVETHEFSESNGITTMRITQAYNSKEDRDNALASGMDQGMEACYQQLDALLT